MASLLVIRGPNIGMRYELGERTRIGRAADNEIQVPDAGISRVHAEVEQRRLAFIIHDRESTNGVVVNGTPVREKLLGRGDEIQVGNTLLLFNADIHIRNARFTNNSVYLYSADAQTVALTNRHAGLERLQGAERQAIDFIMRLAEWFAVPPVGVHETADRLLQHVMEMFMADAVALLLCDPETVAPLPPEERVGRPEDPDRVGRRLRPIAALPQDAPMRMNRELIYTAAREATALMAGESGPPPAMMKPDDEVAKAGAEAGRRNAPGLSTICAPMINGDSVMGMIVVEKNELDFYSLRDLGLLQAIAGLATGAVHAAHLVEKIEMMPPEPSNSNLVASMNARVQQVFRDAQRAALTNVSVLIQGESGTGKEVLAKVIHRQSPRAAGPFVPLNCGAIPGALFESELFGHEKGAFTGAIKTTPGKVEMAHGGTLFLDEVGELDLAMQPKLLRFLQDHAYYRVGGNRPLEADVRIIAATNADLAEAVRQGRFREDLWYRLNVMSFEMPPLRERTEDIPAMVDHLVRQSAVRLGRKVTGIQDEALWLLQRQPWGGNIRELANVVERAVLLSDGPVLTAAHFNLGPAVATGSAQALGDRPVETLAQVERSEIVRALQAFGGNQARAAEALGVHRNTLRNKIADYGIDAKDAR